MELITESTICAFEQVLRENERADATIEKYGRELRKLMAWLHGRAVSRALLIEYRESLRCGHAIASVNGSVSAINAYLDAVHLPEYRLKLQKIQKQVFRSPDREMTQEDYDKLIQTAEQQGKTRLLLIMETICATGIRVSELPFITVEAAETRKAEVTLKGKTRTIFIPKKMARKLIKYARKKKIVSGSIFLTRNGTPISRKQIWAEMKSLCEAAGVNPSGVFPHNLRHLFARRYYEKTRNLSALSNILGHSSVDTTQIYLITTGEEQAEILETLGLVS